MRRIRSWVYRLGFRPKQGNPFHSPSLALVYVWKDRGGLLSQQKLSGTDFDGDTVLHFDTERVVSQHPDIPDMIKSMTWNPNPIVPFDEALSYSAADILAVNSSYGKTFNVSVKARVNPWVAGTDEWHEFNLHGRSWGHVETTNEDDRDIYMDGVVYGATHFIWDAQKAIMWVDELISEKMSGDSEDDGIIYTYDWLPSELM